jgi:hypothetical protein
MHYPDVLRKFDPFNVQCKRVASLGVVLDGMITILVCAPAIETRQTHVQTPLAVLWVSLREKKKKRRAG